MLLCELDLNFKGFEPHKRSVIHQHHRKKCTMAGIWTTSLRKLISKADGMNDVANCKYKLEVFGKNRQEPKKLKKVGISIEYFFR